MIIIDIESSSTDVVTVCSHQHVLEQDESVRVVQGLEEDHYTV